MNQHENFHLLLVHPSYFAPFYLIKSRKAWACARRGGFVLHESTDWIHFVAIDGTDSKRTSRFHAADTKQKGGKQLWGSENFLLEHHERKLKLSLVSTLATQLIVKVPLDSSAFM